MTKLFSIQAKDIVDLIKFYKRAPQQFQRASGMVLNSFAFGTRKAAIDTINDEMTVRNPRFVSSSLLVDKTPLNAKFTAQEATIGSIKRDRFSGWIEQQTGKRRKKTRVATLLARGQSAGKQVKPSVRMKPSKDFPDPSEFKNSVPAMLNALTRKKHRKPFILKKFSKFKPGLYKFLRKKIVKLQDFDSKKAQPKRLDWMGIAIDKYFRAHPIRDTWADALRRVLKL